MAKPIKRFQVGTVGASVFENKTTGKDGKEQTWHSVTIDRVYTDKEGNRASTNSFNLDDLPKVQLAASQAYEFLHTLDRGKSFADRVQRDEGGPERG